jgi:RND superfamily putative drug exporter
MFQSVGKLVAQIWPLFLASWVALLVVSWWIAPPWSEVAPDREFAFLPKDAPSRQSEELMAQAFPDERLGSNIVLVVRREGPQAVSLDQTKKFIEEVLEPALRQIAEKEGGLASEAPSGEPLFPDETTAEPTPPRSPPQRSIIARIRTPNAPVTGALLVSEDTKALLVVIDLTTEFLTHTNWRTIEKVEKLIGELRSEDRLPRGVDIALTGSAVIGRDHTMAELQGARATERITVLLVVVLLILIYRAPLLALIPLATVFLAVKTSIYVLAILAQAGYVALFEGIQIYVTVLSYGAGVDYCLFLTARYKEELDGGARHREATANAIGKVGAALAASAATVVCGIGMMWFAKFGKFHQAGVIVPFSLFVVLLATLTFSPSLLRLTGRWAFWPQRPNKDGGIETRGEGWRRFLQENWFQRNWDKLAGLLLRRPGTVWLVAVVLMAPFAGAGVWLYDYLTYDLIGNLPANATNLAGTRALQEHFPIGLMGPTTVLIVNERVDFRTEKGRALVQQLTDRLRERKDELGLADLRSLAAPLGITAAAKNASAGLDLPQEAVREAVRRESFDRYVTDLGGRAKIGTRLDLILEQSPFSRQSIDNLVSVERIFGESLPPDLQDSQLYFAGPTASMRDLRQVTEEDRRRIQYYVLTSVFVILLLLLRRPVISFYLILSVLFSYLATLGVTFALFWMLDPAGFTGIDWKVAIFLFTILIAVGEDYNIFLMTRIDEERQHHGPIRGVTKALTRTGPIISSCGIIMAGTFASLMAGSLTEMKQLGFALAFGVLLDTFVVRPILVPAFLILLAGIRSKSSTPTRPSEISTSVR